MTRRSPSFAPAQRLAELTRSGSRMKLRRWNCGEEFVCELCLVVPTKSSVLKSCEMKEVTVHDVKPKAIEIKLGLFMSDALHLATALHLGAEYFVVDDHHFLAPEVVSYAAGSGVRIVNLPDLIATLGATPSTGNEATNQDT